MDDVVATADYYRDKLGFRYERLSQVTASGPVRPNHVADPEREAWDAYIWTEDADALREEFASRGVYRLCFGHDIEGSA